MLKKCALKFAQIFHGHTYILKLLLIYFEKISFFFQQKFNKICFTKMILDDENNMSYWGREINVVRIGAIVTSSDADFDQERKVFGKRCHMNVFFLMKGPFFVLHDTYR